MNTKLTNILLIVLLIINIAFVTKWWMGHHKFRHPDKTANVETTAILNDRYRSEMFLANTLGFDSLQAKKLENALQNHFNFLNKYMNAYIRNQSGLFNALKNDNDSINAFRCADSLGILKVAMERELYSHFIHIKNICNSSQQQQFDALIDNMSKEFMNRHNFHNNGGGKANKDSL